MIYKKLLLSGLGACLYMLGVHADTVPTIRVQVDKSDGNASSMIYGQNIEAARGAIKQSGLKSITNNGSGYWDPAHNCPFPLALDALKDLKCHVIRYPGGCLAHNYDFRQSIGPLQDRPEWKFGLDEFMRLCKESGAEPLITLPDYLLPIQELPKHHAELVEYLNAPAKPEYPQAMKRAANGHPEPYGVKYFEIGNETYHPNHGFNDQGSYSIEMYCTLARESMQAIRKVDSNVKLGLVTHLMGLGENPDDWNTTLYQQVAGEADFLAYHVYSPRQLGDSIENAEANVAVSSEVIRQRINNARRLMQKYIGRELPIAITEFNVSYLRGKHPYVWRFSYAAGLNLCEFMMEMRRPEHQILMANYWQTVGGNYGSLHLDPTGKGTYNAVWPFLSAFTKYSSDNIVHTELLNVPKIELKNPIAGQVMATGDQFVPAKTLGELTDVNIRIFGFDKETLSIKGDLQHMTFKFKDCSKVCYPNFASIPVPSKVQGNTYSVSLEFEAKYTPDPSSTGSVLLSLSLMDSRGYKETRLAKAVNGLEKASEWTKFRCPSLSGGPDTSKQLALIKVEKLVGTFSGTLEIRNLKFTYSSGAIVPAPSCLGVQASRDGNTLYLAVINRAHEATSNVRIELDGIGKKGITGTAEELYQSDITTVKQFAPTSKTVPTLKGNAFDWTFPPFSATFFKFQIN